jgi:excisionase family DNA binding protein
MEKTKLLLRPSEAAEMLSISRSKIYELIARGTIPSVKLGGTMLRVPLAAIRDLAESAIAESAKE